MTSSSFSHRHRKNNSGHVETRPALCRGQMWWPGMQMTASEACNGGRACDREGGRERTLGTGARARVCVWGGGGWSNEFLGIHVLPRNEQ